MRTKPLSNDGNNDTTGDKDVSVKMLNTYSDLAVNARIFQKSGVLVRSAQASSCIPPQVSSAVPLCAASCIEAFTNTNYGFATCEDKQSLDFLCTHNSGTGLTIGEAGLQCVVSSCTGDALSSVGVYGICSGIMNSIPETVNPITATVAPAVVSSSTLPSSIGLPTSTEVISTIVTATGAPSLPSTTLVPSSFATLSTPAVSTITTVPPIPTISTSASLITSSPSIPASQSTSTSVTAPSKSEARAGLSTGQIIGISVAGFATATIIFAILLCILCLKKKRKERRRSERWSMHIDKHAPAGSPPSATNFHLMPDSSSVPNLIPSQRFYAPLPAEEKRRSFWRRSIKPEDIGVAVSPEVVQWVSPTSTSSQRTTSRLLPSLPNAALWPAPLNLDLRQRDQHLSRPYSSTAALERARQNLSGMHSVNDGIQQDSRRQHMVRKRIAPLLLDEARPSISSAPFGARKGRTMTPPRSGRIPLTPIYDNGNFNTNMQLARPPNLQIIADAQRAHDRSKPPTRYHPQSQRKGSLHKSVASDSTTFEDDSTPEQEVDVQLGIAPPVSEVQFRSQPSPVQIEDTSPIRDLRYPRMPRPASLSRQAEKLPRPRLVPQARAHDTPYNVPPLRANLVTADLSCLQSETTSDWSRYPQIDSSSELRKKCPGPMAESAIGLRVRTNNETNWARNSRSQAYAKDDVFVDQPHLMYREDSRPGGAPMASSPPPPQARLTPNRTRDGDLYLTVEH